MNEYFDKGIESISPFGFGFLQMVANDCGKAIDYIFLDVSAGFQKMIGLHRDNILGKKASEVFLGKKRKFDWIEYFRGAIISKKIHEISRYVEVLDRDCNVIVVPSGGECFALIIRDKKVDLKVNTYQSTTINMLLAALREQCEETKEHASRLEAHCHLLGLHFQLTSEEMEELSLLAVLHDIGKIGVNPAILKKPAPLTSKEWIEMKRHSEIGCRIVKEFPDLGAVANYILFHHERWDGKGYPSGLKADNIPLPSRILTVADAYDAMTSDRVYRKSMGMEEAIAELTKNAGMQFDPQIVSIFKKTIMS
ncbi:HD-GYP domain-containing protein (c-di-GMP phosphodiesterase class II) [Anaerotaenia torta]|uniref:HD-GYP domain-containing protein n=1 Tax=Anaerotaenia torta TaxID=433293 RepID=UPI003D1A4FE6